jgi:hypothetical protein
MLACIRMRLHICLGILRSFAVACTCGRTSGITRTGALVCLVRLCAAALLSFSAFANGKKLDIYSLGGVIFVRSLQSSDAADTTK